MERILNAIETIESGTARKFGLEDDKTKLVFSLTEFLREIFAEEEEVMVGSPTTTHGVVCFNDLIEMDEEEAEKVIADLSAEETEAFIREGMCKLFEGLW